MGLCLLPETQAEIARRRDLHAVYDAALAGLPLARPQDHIQPHAQWNYAYYPVLFPDEAVLQRVRNALVQEHIYPRRYFYPALTTLPYVRPWHRPCPVTESAARRVLCLPLHGHLPRETVTQIAQVLCAQFGE